MGKQWKQWLTLFSWAPKSLQMVTAAMKLKDALLLERKAMTNLDSILKSRDITLPTKVHLVKAMVFPFAMYVGRNFPFKEPASFNFMATITICSHFGAPQNSLPLFPLFPHLFPMKWWDRMSWSSFSECWALSQLFHSLLALSSRGFLVPVIYSILMHIYGI